jgi:hypothetical protein
METTFEDLYTLRQCKGTNTLGVMPDDEHTAETLCALLNIKSVFTTLQLCLSFSIYWPLETLHLPLYLFLRSVLVSEEDHINVFLFITTLTVVLDGYRTYPRC